MNEFVHALPPLDNRKGMNYADPPARCGGAGRVALFAEDVTCPDCIEQMAADTLRANLRTGVERAQNTVGSVVLDLSVWEGRGDWSALPAEQRREAGARGLEHLDAAIAALEAQREQLRAALGVICRKCHQPFDPADTRFDGRAEDRSTPGYCRSCVDRCHEGDSDHRCPICV